jgi:hypothetical protein
MILFVLIFDLAAWSRFRRHPQSRRLLDWMSQTSVHCINKVARCKIGAGSRVVESPAPILRPHPRMMPDEVGVVISSTNYG